MMLGSFVHWRIQILFQFIDKQFSHLTEYGIFSNDISNLHRTVRVLFITSKRNRNKITAIQFLTDDSRAKCISIQPHHQIQHRGAVICPDHLRILICRQYLFRKVKGTVVPLLEREARIPFQLCKTD